MLFVANKPVNISSNSYLSHLKKRFNTKKLGYSGTLDPFASGCLLIASGNLTKLFNHFNLSPKVYIATLWLGAESSTLDITQVSRINIIDEFSISQIQDVLSSFCGVISYTPPKFSAKKINGIRAYELARLGKDFSLKETKMKIYDLELLSYNHPFLRFRASVDKGAYIRSLGEMIAKKLNVGGILSSLERVSEGDFVFDNYAMLNPLDYITYPSLTLPHLYNDFKNGKSIYLKGYDKNTIYKVIFDEFFSIIRINEDGLVEYILNRISLC